MAINKENFKLWDYRALGMSPREAYQRMLKEGLDDSIANIPSQVSNLVNAGIPFERALDIVEEATFNNNFDPYRAALQEYRSKGRVYRSPEPNGRDRIDVDKIVRDILSNKPELGTPYYPPMGMSTSPNSQHSQYSVVPEQPITEGMSPTPSQYPYELDSEANQDLAPEGYTPMPVSRNYTPIPRGYSPIPANTSDIISTTPATESVVKLGLPVSGMYDESAVSTDTNEPSGKVEVGPDTDKPLQPVQVTQPVAKLPVTGQRRAPKPKSYVEPVTLTNKPPVVNNTSVANVTPVQPPVTNATPPVTVPTLSSVVPQAIRHNGGFDNYRRQSVLSALRAAGGISPAEAVQRGIIPWEALNYV